MSINGELSMTRLLSVKELADLLQVSVYSIYAWHRKGQGPSAIRIGNRVRFHPSDVIEWLEEEREKTNLAAEKGGVWGRHTDELKARLKKRVDSPRAW
jgi:excisionase family DNA binding protein